jgi:hypothetical protein
LTLLNQFVDRIRPGLHPRRVARAAAAAVIAIIAVPFLAIAVLLGFGAVVGTRLAHTGTGTLAWALSVAVLVALIALVDLLAGTLAVARIQSGARLGSALAGALRSLPWALVALVAALVSTALLLVLWPFGVVGGLIAALVLRLRHAPGVRRALVTAIPLLPAIVSLAMIPATLAASKEGARSLRGLVISGWAIVHRRRRALVAFVIPAVILSALLSWASTVGSTALDAAGMTDLSLLVIVLALVLLILAVGTALAIAFPPIAEPQPAPVSEKRARSSRLMARVAILVTVSVVASILPVLSTGPVFADPLTTPVLTNGIDGTGPSPLLSAEVVVPGGDPSGTVQFFDGTVPIGSPVQIVRSTYDTTDGTARLSTRPVLDPGQHSFSFAFTPAGSLVASATSDPAPWHFTATGELAITVDDAAAVGTAADVTVTVGADYPTSVTPEGSVDIEWTGGSATATLNHGVAHATIPTLVDPEIDASYAGSSDFTSAAGSLQVGVPVVPENTVTTAGIFTASYPLGSVLGVDVDVTAPDAPFGTVVKGQVLVYSGSTLLAESTNFRNSDSIQVPTASLHTGSADLTVQFVPATGFSGSDTTVSATIAPATTTVVATISSSSTSWGNPLTLAVTATSSLDGTRTVEVRDTRTDTVVATQDLVVSAGTGTTSIALGSALRPASYALVATVLGDSDHDAAASGSSSVSIGPAATGTTLTVSPSPGEVGSPVTVIATVTSTAGLADAIAGAVTFRAPDGTQQLVAVSAGTAVFSWTPSQPVTGNVTASFFDVGFQFAGSSSLQAVSVFPAVTAAPTTVWSGSLTPADRTVTLSYTASSGHDLPTGTVRVLDANGVIVANALLDNGVVTMRIDGTTGAHPVLRAVYFGDDVYGTRTDVIPVDTLTNYLPTVTVTAPATADLGTAFTVSVDVASVPLTYVSTVTLTDVAPGGATSALGSVTLDGSGHGSRSVTLLVASGHQIGATVTFTTASQLADAPSTGETVVVAPVPVPSLAVTSPTGSSSLVAGGSLDLDVTAGWIGTGTTGVPAGTTAEVRDGANTLLGTVTLLGGSGISGYRGRLHVTNLRGGTLSVHAVVVYGPLSATVSSPVLDIPITAPATDLVVDAGSVTVGTATTVTVTAYPVGGLSGTSRSIPATVTAGGVDYPLVLTRSSATGPFSAAVAVPTGHAGDLPVSASILGDGVDTSAASAGTVASVAKRSTSIVSSVIQSSAAGDEIVLSADLAQAGSGTSPAPTGGILIVSDLGSARCTIDPGQQCVIPGDQVRDGANGFSLYYDGDSDNLASMTTLNVSTGPRTSQLSVSYSPAVGSWVFGDPVTATWTTTTSGRAAQGAVLVTIAGTSCSGTAVSGSCTLIPRGSVSGGRVSTGYQAVFLPSDDAPSTRLAGETGIYSCVFPVILGRADYSRAVRCGSSHAGIRTDSVITLSATPTTNYLVDHWTFGGVVIPGITPSVTVESNGTYVPVQRYAPTCYTLTIAPLAAARSTNGGYLTSYTPPNCSDPSNPTTSDLAALAAGHPRYAVGTTVDIDVVRASADYTVDALSGFTLVNNDYGTVLMDGNRSVGATFKVAACTPVSIFAAPGGSAAISKAVRPTSSATLAPATGACITSGGLAGYVPGTTLTFTATPGPATTLDSWKVITGAPYLAAGDVTLVPVTSLFATPGATYNTQTVVVPVQGAVQVAARFAGVKCVSVSIVSRTIIGVNATNPYGPLGAFGRAVGTQDGCGGIATTHSVRISGSGWYRITTDTASYVASGRVDVTTNQTLYAPSAERNVPGLAHVTWNAPAAPGVTRLIGNGYNTFTDADDPSAFGDSDLPDGPSIDLTLAAPTVTVYANWVLDDFSGGCFAPKVALPQGGSFLITQRYVDEPFCTTPGFVAAGEQATLRAANPVGAPGLTAMLTDLTTGRLQGSPAAFIGSDSYELEYCAPITLDVRIHDDSGHVTTATAAQAVDWFDDDGGCPNGWSRPNRTTRTGLSSDGATNYTVIGNPDGFGPTLAIDSSGTITGSTTVDLQVVCFTLGTYDSSITTPGNCPGGASNRFLRGSQVQVQADSSDRFDGWGGSVDAQQGETGWVIMDADREVSADLHNYSTWDKIGNAVSSVAERAVGAVATFATGFVLSQAYLVKATGWVLVATASILNAVGVKGAAVDAIDKAGQVVGAQFDVLSLLSSCISGGAPGGDAPLLTVPAGGVAAPDGGSADDVVAQAKAQLADQLAKEGINVPIPLGAGTAGKLINAFGSAPSAYSADAASAWSSYGSSITACTQRGVDTYVATTYGG